MATLKSPAELAKETLLRLAQERLPPTPEHFARKYAELAGIPEYLPEKCQRLLELAWSDLIRRLVAAWELPHRDWTTEMKKRSLERVLATKNPLTLFERLNSLVEAWKRSPTEQSATEEEAVLPLPQPSAESDCAALVAELLHLLDVLLRNIETLTPRPEWLTGQIELLRATLQTNETPALDLAKLREAEVRLEETLNRQAALVTARRAAEERLKALLAHFLDEVAQMSSLSADYQKELEQAADVIEKASDISEISPLLNQLLEDTRAMHQSIARSHQELTAVKAEAEAAESRVRELEAQVAQLSALVARDPLTGLLNRRGLEESFTREHHRAKRSGTPLSIALIDLDNFKQLNDTLGHQAGDEALLYLARMARTHLRAQDIVGRFGGEEFVVLLPDTSAEDAAEVIRRLQRALTRELFFFNDSHRVITFSAGVTPVTESDTLESALARADAAMYEAKRSGKNRVVVHKG
ncbi:GGDEF domain-containing protein [Hydrogenophilus islandicus]